MEMSSLNHEREELIMAFGQAIVVKLLGGACEVRGGSEQERKQALEWLERFHPQGSEPDLPSDAQWKQAMRP